MQQEENVDDLAVQRLFTEAHEKICAQYRSEVQQLISRRFDYGVSEDVMSCIAKEDVNLEYARYKTIQHEFVSACKARIFISRSCALSQQIWEESIFFPLLLKLFIFITLPITLVMAFFVGAVLVVMEDFGPDSPAEGNCVLLLCCFPCVLLKMVLFGSIVAIIYFCNVLGTLLGPITGSHNKWAHFRNNPYLMVPGEIEVSL